MDATDDTLDVLVGQVRMLHGRGQPAGLGVQGADRLVVTFPLDVDIEDVEVCGPSMGHVFRCAPVPFSYVAVLIVLPAGIVPTGADAKLFIG